MRSVERRPRGAAAGMMLGGEASLQGVPPAWVRSAAAVSVQLNDDTSKEIPDVGSRSEGSLGGLNEEVEKIMSGDGMYRTARDMLVAASEGRRVFDGDASLSRRPSSVTGGRRSSIILQRRRSSVMVGRHSSASATFLAAGPKHQVVDETAGMGRLQGMLKQLELDHAAKSQLPQTDIYVKAVRASHLAILEGYRSADPLIQVKIFDTAGRGVVEVKKTAFKRQSTDPWFSTSFILNGRQLDEESYLEVRPQDIPKLDGASCCDMRPCGGGIQRHKVHHHPVPTIVCTSSARRMITFFTMSCFFQTLAGWL